MRLTVLNMTELTTLESLSKLYPSKLVLVSQIGAPSNMVYPVAVADNTEQDNRSLNRLNGSLCNGSGVIYKLT